MTKSNPYDASQNRNNLNPVESDAERLRYVEHCVRGLIRERNVYKQLGQRVHDIEQDFQIQAEATQKIEESYARVDAMRELEERIAALETPKATPPEDLIASNNDIVSDCEAQEKSNLKTEVSRLKHLEKELSRQIEILSKSSDQWRLLWDNTDKELQAKTKLAGELQAEVAELQSRLGTRNAELAALKKNLREANEELNSRSMNTSREMKKPRESSIWARFNWSKLK